MILLHRMSLRIVAYIVPLSNLACFASSIFAIRRCQPEADSAFFDLEAQAALLIIVSLLAQFRELGGIG